MGKNINKVFIDNLPPNAQGRSSGPQMRMFDLLKMQTLQERWFVAFLKNVVVPASSAPQVAGFEMTLTEGLSVSIAYGVALDLEGILYDSAEDATVVELAEADPLQPRIDLIVAVLGENVPAGFEERTFKEHLSYSDRVMGYMGLESPHTVPTELGDTATIVVKTGEPGAVPVAPAPGANEVPLWKVRVDAGAIALTEDKLTDVRNLFAHLGNPIDTDPARGIGKEFYGPYNRLRVFGLIAAADQLGMVKLSPPFSSDPDGTLQIALATALLKGAMSPAHYALLVAATNAATANTLMKRNATGDASLHDLTLSRRLTFSDDSYRESAWPSEHRISFCSLATPVAAGGGVAGEVVEVKGVPRPGGALGGGFDLIVKVEDFNGVPLIFQCYAEAVGGTSTLELYNVTNGTVLASIIIVPGTTVGARTDVFNLTGTGRKRLRIRHRESSTPPAAGVVLYVWNAAIVINPMYTACGFGSFAACPT
ncbi:MAG TPA: hypothetical protein VE842_03125 [Pyrinomonadaceae bacterium]|nr:hypothetical protein [Pyrinomonadaceae bacterium]